MLNTKASFCITTEKLEKFLPKNVERIIVKNVLFELAKVLKKCMLMPMSIYLTYL